MRDVVDFLKNRFQREIQAHHVIEPKSGTFAGFPETLAPRLREVLVAGGIQALYSHQAEAAVAAAAPRWQYRDDCEAAGALSLHSAPSRLARRRAPPRLACSAHTPRPARATQ